MALAVCWKNLETPLGDGHKISETSEKRPKQANEDVSFEEVKKDMRKVGKLFISVVKGQVDIKSELEPLMEAQPGLQELFTI